MDSAPHCPVMAGSRSPGALRPVGDQLNPPDLKAL
jgi:hypothetical protein